MGGVKLYLAVGLMLGIVAVSAASAGSQDCVGELQTAHEVTPFLSAYVTILRRVPNLVRQGPFEKDPFLESIRPQFSEIVPLGALKLLKAELVDRGLWDVSTQGHFVVSFSKLREELTEANTRFHERVARAVYFQKEYRLPRGEEDDRVESLTISPDNQYLAGGTQSGRICIWERVSGRLQTCVQREARTIHAVAFSEAGDALEIREIFRGRTVKLVGETERRAHPIYFYRWNFLTKSYPKKPIHDRYTWTFDNPTVCLDAHPFYISLDEPQGFLSIQDSSQMELVENLPEGRQVRRWRPPSGGFKTLAVSRDEKWMAFSTDEGAVWVWEMTYLRHTDAD